MAGGRSFTDSSSHEGLCPNLSELFRAAIASRQQKSVSVFVCGLIAIIAAAAVSYRAKR
jgi:hypothetical protein